MLAALIAALRKPSQQAGQEVAEEVSKKLPAAVMPRGAIEAQRKRLADLDALGREQ
jgi:hypothetical protein